MGVEFLKRCLLAFWATWLSVVFLTNLADAGKALGLLPESWAFASGNFLAIGEATARYETPVWLNGVMFAGVIAWEGTAAALFWRAWGEFRGRSSGRRWLIPAFTTSLMLWSAFLLADEVFITYAAAGTHLRLFVAQLVTLIAVVLLPEDAR
jgi:hypothetical protein